MISRKEAKQKKLNKYQTGLRCSNGHLDWRYTNSGACISCIKMYAETGRLFKVTVVLDSPQDKQPLLDYVAALNLARRLSSEPKLTFENWIVKQKDRDDPIGDLAVDYLRDTSRPRPKFDLDYLRSKRAPPEVVRTHREAMKEYFREITKRD